MITVIDYGLGNIKAFQNVYQRLNIPCKVAQKADDLEDAKKIILPGVGAFDQAMNQLNDSGMRAELENQVMNKKVPVMGICVGMQILANSSEEGKEPGLGFIEGAVKRFIQNNEQKKTPLPHMGWNNMTTIKNNPLLMSFNGRARFYFLHSYYFECLKDEDIISVTEYGVKYASAINKDNIYGIQFHPEKSHQNGVQLLFNFATL